MVAVQVRHQHSVDRRGIDPEPLHGDERGCPAIDEEGRSLGAHVDAGVEPAPLPKVSPLPKNRMSMPPITVHSNRPVVGRSAASDRATTIRHRRCLGASWTS